jgi:hypothetical protein
MPAVRYENQQTLGLSLLTIISKMLSRRVLAAASRLPRPVPHRPISAPAARFSTAHAMRIQKGLKGETETLELDDPEMVLQPLA